MDSLISLLNSTHQKRLALNPRYSKNAFARDLGVSPASLSQVLSRKRRFSRRNLQNIVKNLSLSPEVVTGFTSSSSVPTESLALETFSLISEWYHFGILNLTEVEKVTSLKQITKRLGISPEEARQATDRLLKLNFLKKENGVMKRTQVTLDAGTDVPSEALRKHNREKMELAILSLRDVPLSKRDISSVTLTLNPGSLHLVKKEIATFKQRISKICKAKAAQEVYSLNIQFFPLTKETKL